MKTSLAPVGLVIALLGASGCTYQQLRTIHAPTLVHPLCIHALVSPAASPSQSSTINLPQCQKKYGHLPFTTDAKYGVVWQRDEDTSDDELPAYVAYKIIGQIGQQLTLVQFSANYNGSGLFSSALLLQGLNEQGQTHDQRNLTLQQNIVGGDRCNNGIENLLIESPTSFLMVRKKTLAQLLSPDNSERINFGTLPDCATCCAGTSTERYTLNTDNRVDHKAEPQQSVIFPSSSTQPGFTSSAEDCVYNTLLKHLEFPAQLTPKQQQVLSEDFQEQCSRQ